jgi:hypothetical protein
MFNRQEVVSLLRGRSGRNLLFSLQIKCLKYAEYETRQAYLSAMPKVCRLEKSVHLFIISLPTEYRRPVYNGSLVIS